MKPLFKNYITKQPDGTEKLETFEGFLELPKIRDCVGNRIYEGSVIWCKKIGVGIVDYDPKSAFFSVRFKHRQDEYKNIYLWGIDNLRVIGHLSDQLYSLISEDSYLNFLTKVAESFENSYEQNN